MSVRRVRLRDIGGTYGGLAGKSKADFERGTASFVTFLEVINNTRLRGLSLAPVNVASDERQNTVLRGDVLFNGSSETPEEVALSAVVDFDPGPATYLNSFCFGYRLTDDDVADPTYLAYLFRSSTGRKGVSSLAQGATRYNIAKTKLLDVVVSLPSLDRQREVAGMLTDTDDSISALERLIAKKQAIKQGALVRLLTGETRLPSFTAPWVKLPFEALAAPAGERAYGRAMPSGTPLVELEHVGSGSGRLLETKDARDAISLKTVFRPGDVLFGKLRAYLRKYWLADRSGLCSTEIWALRPKPATIGAYVRYLVETERFVEVASGGYGTHMPRSDWRTLRDLMFDVPPVDEQRAIASVLRDADSEIEMLGRRVEKAKAVRQGMMDELFAAGTRQPALLEVAG